MSTSLYRHFDQGGTLLYIGITDSMAARLIGHHRFSRWFGSVATIKVTHFENRAEAEAAEKAAIRAEHPRFNIQHNVSPAMARAYQPTGRTDSIHGYLADYLVESGADPHKVRSGPLLSYLSERFPDFTPKRIGMELRAAGVTVAKTNGKVWYIYPRQYRSAVEYRTD